jgi:hypothetical protein
LGFDFANAFRDVADFLDGLDPVEVVEDIDGPGKAGMNKIELHAFAVVLQPPFEFAGPAPIATAPGPSDNEFLSCSKARIFILEKFFGASSLRVQF